MFMTAQNSKRAIIRPVQLCSLPISHEPFINCVLVMILFYIRNASYYRRNTQKRFDVRNFFCFCKTICNNALKSYNRFQKANKFIRHKTISKTEKKNPKTKNEHLFNRIITIWFCFSYLLCQKPNLFIFYETIYCDCITYGVYTLHRQVVVQFFFYFFFVSRWRQILLDLIFFLSFLVCIAHSIKNAGTALIFSSSPNEVAAYESIDTICVCLC